MLIKFLRNLFAARDHSTPNAAQSVRPDTTAFKEGVELFASGNTNAAEAKFLAARAAAPDDGRPLYGLGLVAQTKGDYEIAISRLKKALTLGFADPAVRFTLAETHAMAGQPDQARAEFTICIDGAPDFAPAHFGLARVLSAQQHSDEALPHYERAAELFANSGDHQNAAAAWDELSAVAPQRPDAYAGLGRELLALGEPKKVIERISKIKNRFPDNAKLHGLLGMAYSDLERIPQALEAYRKASMLEPDNPTFQVGLGVTLSDAGDNQAAVDCFRKALAIDPHMAEAQFNLGLELYELGEHEPALAHMESCRQINHGMTWALGAELPGERDSAEHHQAPATAVHKLRHDLEQLEFLQNAGRLSLRFNPVVDAYREFVTQLEDHEDEASLILKSRMPALVRATYNRPAFIPACPALSGPAINPALDSESIEGGYFEATPNILYADNLLTQEALENLRRFCLEACIWHNVKAGYLGAYMYGGFCSGLLLQIADELRQALPGILKDHRLQIMWAYKYDSSLSGIATHADQAAVNVNFWLTPDAANLDPDGGGLVVYQHKPGRSWSFREFNAEASTIDRYLAEVGSDSLIVPHRQNRAVIFDSALFHRTDNFHFKSGYENRRINVTMLYGKRQR